MISKIRDIKEIDSVEQLWAYFKENRCLLKKKDEAFINKLACDWDDGILYEKLKELYMILWTDKIKQISPNQTKYEICDEIYKIILDEEE